MNNERFVEILNIHLAEAEANDTLPLELIAELREAFSDPENVTSMLEKLSQTIDDLFLYGTGHRIPTGLQVTAQRYLPPFHDNRPDCLDARICALRYSGEPVIRRDSFIKIISSEK